MFCSDEAVNDLLHYSKMCIDEIARKKKKSNDFIVEQYLIFAGMISYYGFEYIDTIYKAFSKSGFVNDPRTIKEFWGDDYLKEHYTPAFCEVGIVSQSNRYVIERDIHHLNCPNEVYGDFFEELVHEINHCINSANSPICKRNSLPVYRTGISITAIHGIYCEAKYLEEAFNTLQTAEIMNHILSFGQYSIEDSSMRSILNCLAERGTNQLGRGYEIITPEIYPLYSHPNFHQVLKDNRISGDLKTIRNNFDRIVGDGSFFELASSIDQVWNNKDSRQVGKAYQLVSRYVYR